MWRIPALLALLAALTGCAIPADTDGTLDRLRGGGTLRVGVAEHDPWVSLAAADPSGVEVGLVRELASRLGAEVDYTTGGEEELVEALKQRELDVVVGGITDRTRWSKDVAMTKPYLTTHLVVGAPRGAGAPERVLVEQGTVGARLVERKLDAVPVPVQRVDRRGAPSAVDDWLLDDLGLVEHETLRAEEHVMLAMPGENAWLVELERFLLDRKGRALELLQQEGRP